MPTITLNTDTGILVIPSDAIQYILYKQETNKTEIFFKGTRNAPDLIIDNDMTSFFIQGINARKF